ncbi:UDP-N-acetylmuramoylalanine--D-glutamate ligase [Candidatus Burkholderia pumila]|uniref:UDP-N-acetylmuramoylalanine--D-glutamate ligase n=1 Tax=Candidatus Burkholderia pumila TaxID=1090375 RepID=A0ABR5HNP1_9BURK|nr:UDP-N-acetylmuramoylalanine--D-glutamate ligase [Candidatus Burkholderia pumila]
MFGEKFSGRQNPMVLVLGLGESGLAMARWCARHGCRLRIADTRETPPNLSELAVHKIDAEFVGGAFSLALLDGDIELVAISPGLSLLANNLAPLIAAASERGIPVWGELELFAQALASLGQNGYQPKIIAITGTNGKTTTTSLTGLLCERAGKSVAVAGNISPAMLDKLTEAIDQTALPDVWVFELSSFQLETAHTFAPDAATVLNITQDHLDWHGGLDAYAAAKGRIFGPLTTRVLNRDDSRTMKLAANVAQHRVVTFGLNEPLNVGDYGLLRDHGIQWLVEGIDQDASDETPTTTRRRKQDTNEPNLVNKRLMPVDALRIRGLHNAANALAALALTRAIGLPMAALLYGLREYRGEPHRVEVIAQIDGVNYINDSKGTNAGATVAALDGLAQRVVLIAGGDGKGQDFSPLEAPVARWVRAVMLIGRDAPRIRETLESVGVEMQNHATLEDATNAAAKIAEAGDAVLLSPACASLDMFRNYAHRADVFRGAVEEIAAARRVML